MESGVGEARQTGGQGASRAWPRTSLDFNLSVIEKPPPPDSRMGRVDTGYCVKKPVAGHEWQQGDHPSCFLNNPEKQQTAGWPRAAAVEAVRRGWT